MGITMDKAILDNLNYFCVQCKPDDHKELLDGMVTGEKPWEHRAYKSALPVDQKGVSRS
jgi:hypothetical protein